MRRSPNRYPIWSRPASKGFPRDAAVAILLIAAAFFLLLFFAEDLRNVSPDQFGTGSAGETGTLPPPPGRT